MALQSIGSMIYEKIEIHNRAFADPDESKIVESLREDGNLTIGVGLAPPNIIPTVVRYCNEFPV